MCLTYVLINLSYHASGNENIPNISLIDNTEKNCEKEIQGTTNQDIPINLLEPRITLIKLTRQDCEKYIKNSRQPLAFIENTISSKVSIQK